jgi:protein ImuB
MSRAFAPPACRLWLALRLSDTVDELALVSLCDQVYELTPHVQLHWSTQGLESGLLLEVSRSLYLFGGLDALLARLGAQLALAGWAREQYQLGWAHTASAAWLASYLPWCEASLVPLAALLPRADGSEALRQWTLERLAPLPLQCLADFPQAVLALGQMGFVCLGDIWRQVQAQGLRSLGKRLGPDFARYLSELLAVDGQLQQASLFTPPPPLYQPAETFVERLELDYPLDQLPLLQPFLEQLLQRLGRYLQQRQLQCQSVDWHLLSIAGERQRVQVFCDTPQQQVQDLLYELSLIQLERQPLAFAVDQLELHCPHTMPLQAQTLSLGFTAKGGQQLVHSRDFAITSARLKARLGEAALYKLSYVDDQLPELSNQQIPLDQTSSGMPDTQMQALRPRWLLAQPQVIEERKSGLFWRGLLQLRAGPERIHAHWWDKPSARDYFLAQRDDGVRLWVYHDLRQKAWYVQGVFG